MFLCLVPGCILTTVACAAAPVTPAAPASTVSTSGNVTGKAVWPNINSFTVSSDNISPGENVEQWQSGSYMIPMEIPHNARFTARVGLAEDAEDRSGITFLFGVIGPDGTHSFWPGVSANYDGRLEAFDIDLNAYAGKKVMAILRVEAGAATTGNHAAWIDPRISQ